MRLWRIHLGCLVALFLATSIDEASAAGSEQAEGMELVGAEPLQGRPSYQIVPHSQNGKWLLYIGHHPGKALNPLTGETEENGMSVVDVTDPASPRLLRHQPPGDVSWYRGSSATSGTYHVQVCDGSTLPKGKRGKVYVLRTLGEVAQEILDFTDPARPGLVSQVFRSEPSLIDGRHHTHKSFWDCSTGVAYMVGSVSGWHATQVLRIFDLSNPEKPRHIRDFGLPGSEPDVAHVIKRGDIVNGVNAAHEAKVVGDRLYVAYNPFAYGTVQILDLDKLLNGDPSVADRFKPTDQSLRYPEIGRLDMPSYWGVHTTKALLDMEVPDYRQDKKGSSRDILVLLSEGASFGCDRPRHVIFLADMTEPRHPMPISTYQAMATPGNFCSRNVYFGPHNIHAQSSPIFDGKLLFITYFAAGVRVVDIRNPFSPIEVGHYIPAANANTRYVEDKGPWAGKEFERTAMTNDVSVDDRGYIYIVDRARTGLHILRLTGRPAQIAAVK